MRISCQPGHESDASGARVLRSNEMTSDTFSFSLYVDKPESILFRNLAVDTFCSELILK